MEEKLFENWEQLENSIRICKDCKLCQNRNKVVIGEGNKNARIMFIGEGPGADEDIQGRPFVGRAGKLMDQAFKGIGIKREEVYIANVVKCRPPGNRNPEIDEMNACKKLHQLWTLHLHFYRPHRNAEQYRRNRAKGK